MSERRIEAPDEFSAMSPSERFPTEDGVEEEEEPRHFYSRKPDQVWHPRSNNHTPLSSRTKSIFIFIS